MAYGRGEAWFWRLIGIFSLSVCTLNLMVLLKGSSPVVLPREASVSFTPSKSDQSSTKVAPSKNAGSTQPSKEAGKNVPKYLKNPVWPNVWNIKPFFKLENILLLGKRRQKPVDLVIGVPTVHRSKAFYVIDTIRNLIDGASAEERDRLVIIVFVADFNQEYRKRVCSEIETNFKPQVESGVINVIVAVPEFYPPMEDLPPLYGDSAARVQWRSKQSLDYAFLYYYCSDLGKYYLQLEDDVITESGYFKKIEQYIASKQNTNWSTLEFGARGFIGMMYRGENLLSLSRFTRFYFWTMPVDWLFRVYNDIFLYGNTKTNIRRPALFKHIGTFSSLDGQIRKLEDVANGVKAEKVTHSLTGKNNPPATLKTDIKDWVEGHEVTEPYLNGFAWAKTVDVGSTITIEFKKKEHLSRIAFLSGSLRIPSDSLEGSDVSVSTADDCASFSLIKSFQNTVDIDIKDVAISGPVKCVQLKITKVRLDHHQRKRWLLIREIGIWTK